MNKVYHYIIKQCKILQQDYPTENSFLDMIVSTQIEQRSFNFLENKQNFSLAKMTYFIESLNILKQEKIFNVFDDTDVNHILDVFQYTVKKNVFILDHLKTFKVRLLLGEFIEEDTLIIIIDNFSHFLHRGDFLFEKRSVVIICEIIEILLLIKNMITSSRIETIIQSYLDIVVSKMNDVDFSAQKHSFFLLDTTSMIQSLYWEEGDIRKAILLLREDLNNTRNNYNELGTLISQHILLISAISKMESEYFGVQVGILGIVCGFNKLYTVTHNSKFLEESIRWSNILEKSIVKYVEEDQKLDIRRFVDFSLSYNYLKNNKWKM